MQIEGVIVVYCQVIHFSAFWLLHFDEMVMKSALF
jgi:hypothetical protein